MPWRENEHEVKQRGNAKPPDEDENAAQLGFKKNPVEFQEKSSEAANTLPTHNDESHGPPAGSPTFFDITEPRHSNLIYLTGGCIPKDMKQ